MINNNTSRIYAFETKYITDYAKFKKKVFPSFHFFLNMFRIVFYSNRLARKGLYNGEKWVDSSEDIVFSLEKVGVRMYFDGIENLRKIKEPVVFVSNHMSTLETMALPSLIHPNKSVVYVIKEELARYPLFGPIALARDPILVGRENPREDLKIVLEEGSKKLQSGKSIIIFPQKTRSPFFDAASFNSLGVKLAKKNNVKVIPIALITDAWANGKMIKEIGKIDTNKNVHISFGDPMQITGNGAEEHQKVIEFISGKFIEWGREELILKQ